MVWYYDRVIGPIIIRDIYHNEVCNGSNTIYKAFIMEFIFRYSGLLHDKLKHLLSCYYRNIWFGPPAAIYETNRGDRLYCSIFRFNAKEMYLKYYEEVANDTVTLDYLDASVAQILHFIH